MLCKVDWQSVTDVSGQPIDPTFKGQTIQEELDCLTVEGKTDKLIRNVGN
jgi:hypothetical protein